VASIGKQGCLSGTRHKSVTTKRLLSDRHGLGWPSDMKIPRRFLGAAPHGKT